MNETLADLPAIYGFETDTDVFPNIHSMDNAVRGKVLTSVYGGGTANTEYEFLTGNSLYFLPPGSSPYVQYMGSVQQSLAWKLKELGYQTAAYHPYLPSATADRRCIRFWDWMRSIQRRTACPTRNISAPM